MLKKSLVGLLLIAALASSATSVTAYAAALGPQSSFQNNVGCGGSSGGDMYGPSDSRFVDTGDGCSVWEGCVSASGNPGYWTTELMNALDFMSDLLH